MKKLVDFELPYVSLRSSEVENCKVGLRKWWVSIHCVGRYLRTSYHCPSGLVSLTMSAHRPRAREKPGAWGAVKKRGRKWIKILVLGSSKYLRDIIMSMATMRVKLKKQPVGVGIEAGNDEELLAVELCWNGLLVMEGSQQLWLISWTVVFPEGIGRAQPTCSEFDSEYSAFLKDSNINAYIPGLAIFQSQRTPCRK